MGRAKYLSIAACLWIGTSLTLAQEPARLTFAEVNKVTEAPQCQVESGAGCDVRFWIRSEFLLWSVKNVSLPVPLATIGSIADDIPGALGQPNTRILFGGADQDLGMFSGARFSGGVWIAPDIGIEASGFLLERRSNGFARSSDAGGDPLLARPFFNPLENAQNSLIDSVPGSVAGNIDITSSLRLWGWEANAAIPLARNTVVFFGYRTLDLRESLKITDRVVALEDDALTFQGVSVQANSIIRDFDSFQTHNRFHGLQAGGRSEWCIGSVTFGVLGKLGLGWTRQSVAVDGASTLIENGATVTVPGGLLAQSTNIGRRTDSEFAVVPELGLDVGWQLRPNLRFRIGYSYLYWSSVVRPGDQIDPVVNPRLVPTAQDFAVPAGLPNRPRALFNTSDFWAQGVDFGIEFTF